MNYPFRVPAIKIEQPLGVFYVVALPARLLLQVCHSIKTELLEEDDDVVDSPVGKFVARIRGTQRERKPSRLQEIKRYSESVDASFPNAIILGANYQESGMLETDEDIRWSVEVSPENADFFYLNIPSEKKVASIIDGQHRVYGFEASRNNDMELLCSVFLDLPMPYQAQLFTKINTTQKRVDKNLAYNLFQFDMALGDSDTWSPETLSVYFARVLSSDDESPLKGLIRLGISGVNAESTISMASIIDGTLSLITSNAEVDRSMLHTKTIKEGRKRDMLRAVKSEAPLRDLYLLNKDKTLYNIISSFFMAVKEVFWLGEDQYAIFRKTLGIHALFDFLKIIIKQKGSEFAYDKHFFTRLLEKSNAVDFGNDYFGVQSKVRVRLRNTLLVVCGIKSIDELSCSEVDKDVITSLI